VLVGEREIQPLALVAALETARESVAAISDETARGAGSTVAGVAVSVHQSIASWLVFNIGDSRIYRLRDSKLAQLSVDHSLVQELLDRGQISPDEVANFHGKNVITRAVGADDSNADFWLHPIVQNERLLLCSDGLTGEVSDGDIAEVLRSTPGAQAAAEALVLRALDNGGGDNVTVVVLDVREGGVSPLDADSEQHAQRPPESADGDTIELPRAKAVRPKGDN
jgi:protein phosphatase